MKSAQFANANAKPESLTAEVHVREQHDAGGGREHRAAVSRGARPRNGERDRPDELDRSDRGERQVVDRDVEAHVHRCEDGTERDEEPRTLAVEPRDHPPGATPEREHECGRGDAKPRDAEDVDPREEQDGEGRAEVVKDGACREVRLRRGPTLRHAASVAATARSGQTESQALS